MVKQIEETLEKVITVTVKEDYELLRIGERKGTGTKVALLLRHSKFEPYIVAWNYDINDGTWGQGHYLSNSREAHNLYESYIFNAQCVHTGSELIVPSSTH